MKTVRINRQNMLLPIATVGSYGLFKYCVCLHCYMPLALTEAYCITTSLLIMHTPPFICTQKKPPAFVCNFLCGNCQVTAVSNISDLHHVESCRGRMISIILT